MKKEIKAIIDGYVLSKAQMKQAGEWIFKPLLFGDYDFDGMVTSRDIAYCIKNGKYWDVIYRGELFGRYKTLREAFKSYSRMVEEKRRSLWATKEDFKVELV